MLLLHSLSYYMIKSGSVVFVILFLSKNMCINKGDSLQIYAYLLYYSLLHDKTL